ncbi:hypothetical protein ABZ946_35265 [Streptomyces sp. NPDC046324]|uniref:hypothetical protein n=1 Tax=Streptomyces sp. NPDC046324 TaxID=3154915 RepID=UPI0033EBFFDB
MLVTTSCSSSEAPAAADDRLCDISSGSPEEKLLRQVIRTPEFETRIDNRDQRFVEKMEDGLRAQPEGSSASPVLACSYAPKASSNEGRANVEFTWSPTAEAESGGGEKGTRSYQPSASATGTSDDVSADLFVQCRLPGDLNARSKKVLLHAQAAYTVNLGAVQDHGTQDQQMAFLYYMARKATEVLGCENQPLAEEPVVKPLSTEQ